MKEIASVPESQTSNRNWNDPMPVLALLPAELLFYAGYVIVFGIHAMPFCLLLVGAHVIWAFGGQRYCLWNENSYVPKWLGRLILIVLGSLWGTAGILIGKRDPFSMIFGK